jgi:RNA-directed DNA polymerase
MEMGSAGPLESAKGVIGKGLSWLVDSFAHSANPLSDYSSGMYGEWEERARGPAPGSPAGDPDRTNDPGSGLRREALRQVISAGLVLGVGIIRRKAPGIITRAGSTLRTTLSTPAGRRLLKRGAVATSGLAGLAAAAAVTAYLMRRRAGPAPSGVLQGSPLSPLLANVYLHPFDADLSHNGHVLARFADDWVILCQTRDQAEAAYNDALRALARLRLKVNPEKTRILEPGQKLEWLGAVIG